MLISIPLLAAASAVVVCAAIVQSSIGFGFALIAAPLLILLDPALVPGPLIAANTVLSATMAFRDRSSIDVRGLLIALVGRFVGILGALTFLRFATAEQFDLAFGIVVLAAVFLNLIGIEFVLSPRTTLACGAASGLMATVSGIGGPPMALLYQREEPRRLRGTLGAFFLAGDLMVLVGLGFIGRFTLESDALTACTLVPAVLVGFFLAGRLTQLFAEHAVRPWVLMLSFCAGVAMILRAVG